MLVKELMDHVYGYGEFDYPEIEFNGEVFPFTVVEDYVILGDTDSAREILDRLEIIDDDTELKTAVVMKVELNAS